MDTQDRRVNSVAEYRREILAIKEQWPNPALAFRGQESAEWSLESSAERRLRNIPTLQDGIPDNLFIEYHDRLLEKCKLDSLVTRAFRVGSAA